MVDSADVITMDSLLNNPDFDFMKQYNFRDDDNDNNIDNPSPYDNITNTCNYFDLPNFYSSFKNNKIFLSFNIQSLPSKFNEFEELINILSSNNCSPDFICLQEIWQIHNSSSFSLKNYNFEFLTRKNDVQGGVWVFM